MRVLIAVEDEFYSDACVKFVSSHEWLPGAMFKVLHAVEPVYVGDRITSMYGADLENEILNDRVEYAKGLVAKTKEQLSKELKGGQPIETNVAIGKPHQVIVDTAEAWHADMIIMGSHGRKGFTKFLLGSVSLAVLSHANCSVAIVRLPQPAVDEKKESQSDKKAKNEPVAGGALK